MRISDWSSDVCSSDLNAVARRLARDQIAVVEPVIVREHLVGLGRVAHIFLDAEIGHPGIEMERRAHAQDRKSVVKGKRVSVSVDIGGRRFINKKTKIQARDEEYTRRTK